MICLDTNTVIAVMNQRVGHVRDRLIQALSDGDVVGLPTVVLHELWYGVRKSARAIANTEALASFLTLDLELWSFGSEDAEEAGEIRAALAQAGTPIGPYDALIAAQTRRRGAILITAKSNEFGRVPGLQTQDWTKDGP